MRSPIKAAHRKRSSAATAKKAALVVSKRISTIHGVPSTDGALLLTAEKAYYLLDFRYAEAARAGAGRSG